DGNYAFCGENGSLIPDNNGDTWLVKISPSGNILFEASAKNNRTLREVAYDIIETTNKEFVITGYIESFSEGIKDVYAAKYSSNGSFLAEDAYGGRYLGNDNYDDVGFSVVESDSGYFWILGYSKSYGSGGSSDYYLFKVDPQNMNYITGTTYGENETEIGYDMIMRGSNVVMFGASNSNFSPNYYSFTLLEIFEFNRSPKYSFSEYQDSSMNTPLTILQHESDLKFRISPNPFNSFIKVNSQETIQKLKVTDISGKCLFSESTNELNMKIDLDFLQNGIYFLEITTNNSTPSILKIIKGAP
ncbi:MAG: T9SS type A sorting domain-containing protein, partial [Salibacteraceae bacterium]